MDAKRRAFLKAGAVGALAVTNGANAAGNGARPEAPSMARGMTLLSMRNGEGYTLGVKTPKGVLDVKKAARALKSNAPTTMDALIAGGDGGLAELVQQAKSGALYLDEAKIAFGPCVTNPEKIICVGLNYARHAREVGQPIPKLPILFNKYNNALTGHRGVVKVSQEPAEKFDYEIELVIVLGKTARNVSEADALSYVFGYCTGNDLSARDLQSRTSQWMLGKTFDGSGPVGPYLVSADQVPDPNALKLELKVNGEVRQSSNTADMVFDCKALIAYISRHMTLRPGDIIFTGTPEGVISGYPKDKQVWLKPGDKIAASIEKLGTQEITLA